MTATPIDVLRDLLTWDRHMGCFEASVWDRARAVVAVHDAEQTIADTSHVARCESQGHDWREQVPSSDGTGPSIYRCQWCGEVHP